MPNDLTLPDFTSSQLVTIKNTVCRDANDLEFDLFMNMARQYGLDPFRKHLHMIIYNKNKPEKRTHAIFPSRDGWRILAGRQRDYRPASGPAQFVCSDDAKDESANPQGIISCGVTLHKQDSRGEWNPVYGEAYWHEFAKVSEIWANDPETRKYGPTGKFELSGKWKEMPRLMIQKCAEGQALRAGWPDVFGGLYHQEEISQPGEQPMRDVTPSEEVAEQQTRDRQALLGGRSIFMSLDETGSLERVPVGQVADRCAEYVQANDAEAVYIWAIRNREPLREFWAASPGDALELKRMIEAKTESVGAEA